MASVTIRNVEKVFGSIKVIHGVDIEVAEHEFVVLVGPSGCGKSTLLRMIAGLETISSGDIMIGERVVNKVPARDRDIAMVFQNYALYPHMNIFDNMGFSLKLRKRPKSEIDRKVMEAAETLNLRPYLQRSPAQLSGGQRQRVAMGRALVRDAQVFLFDEPLSNLDAKLRVTMRTEIKALHQRLKTTSVYVTHDQIEAMTMADRIVVMRDGRVEQVGAPLELYDRPGNLFVADFLGSPSMNFIEGNARRSDGAALLETANGSQIPLPENAPVVDGQPVVLGLRPEHLSLTDPEEGFAATVKVVEPTGANVEVFFDFAGQEVCAVFNERYPLVAGQKMAISWLPDKVHLFDGVSGQRLESE
ncbi:ABC transporter ATP-binding protein [Aliiruegeria lutimaris]|uniref:Carbohydrate ABC transporter ATP-binding protein, CUT1 family n=1 Tax=Aliiruegeria lutimaris TaxID=571298 RepID=A0A1G9DBH8_9RHOB|nr:sn-glycerol-3-phosphate ABC transporter ATP-binding protein UgpC [Aliiruegeria lutimaris]SDK61175.1 carbohydrate ABC transporter ATP-binding protein, CUT1 family [Aliiruegeria lutimaris]